MFLFWLPPLAFTLFIYTTLSSVPKVWEMAFSKFGRPAIKVSIEITVALLFFAVLVYLVFFVKNHRTSRILWLFAIGFVYAYLISTIEIVVEQVHLLEYGILGGLYLLPWQRILKDKTAYFAAWTFTFSAGIIDELSQYYSPTRVGTVPDICLNGYASALALLLVAKVFSRVRFDRPVTSRNIRIVSGVFVFNLLLLGAFISIVTDYGFLHKDPQIGAFYSHFTVEGLKKADRLETAKNIAAVKDLYPVKMHTYLKDQGHLNKFYAEILVHLFRRDRYVEKGDLWVAYKENLVLDAYFTETIRGSGFAWPPEKIKQIESELKIAPDRFYESPVAKDDVIVMFGPATLWGFILPLICILSALAVGGGDAILLRLKWATNEAG